MSIKGFLSQVLPNFPSPREQDEIEVLKELPTETVYLALKETDKENALWFYQNARPDQVQGIVDLDCWEGDSFLPDRFEALMKDLVQLHPLKLRDFMKSLDPEVIVRGLLELCEVDDFDPQNPPERPESQFMITLDSKYVLLLKTENPETREMLFQWINKMSAGDIELLRRHLESCKWEMAGDLEEFGYQLKKGRLEDMGFVENVEAIALYARGTAPGLKKKMLETAFSETLKFEAERRLRKGEAEEEPLPVVTEDFLPVPMAEPLMGEGFLKESFALVTDEIERNILMLELVRTVNAAFTADKVLHKGLEEIRETTLRTRRYIDLGLVYLSGAKAELGANALKRHRIFDIARLGWLMIQDLVSARRDLLAKHKVWNFSTRDQELLNQLDGRHPVLDESLIREFDIKTTHIINLEAVLLLGTHLAQLMLIGDYFDKDLSMALLTKDYPLSETDSGFARLATGFFRQASGNDFNCRPLTHSEWTQYSAKFSQASVGAAVSLVVDRCPRPAQALFSKRLMATLQDIEFYIRNSKGKIPDARYFKSLSWMSSEQSSKLS